MHTEQVRLAVADFLQISPERIDPSTSLTAYGIDSLGALELVASLEDRFECTLPESLLTDCPDLERLASALSHSGHPGPDNQLCSPDASRALLGRMLADSRLPDDVRPTWTGAEPDGRRVVLLTGATGFLGASLLRSLIDANAHVVCLVRSAGGDPAARVRANLRRFGIWHDTDEARITPVTGDIERPRLGLDDQIHDRLVREVSAVYHAAADVNWVSSYDALRSANVTSTISLLRFACTGLRKRFHFVSSLSVCFAHEGPREVSEDTDMLGHVDRLPLGYAQSKCVAEALVRHAAARGVSAQIFRPALLAGHSVSGASNVDDLTAALIKGCIQMGAAPDLDWVFDAVPVDTAADTIVHLSQSQATLLETFHLRHPRPRHWRECVLWANFFGYPIRLEPYSTWVERLMREARTADHALYRLRSFFTRQSHGRSIPEQYEEHTRSRVVCAGTQRRERANGTTYPPLDAQLLDLFFQDYIRRQFLPPPAGRTRSDVPPGVENVGMLPQSPGGNAERTALFESLLREHFTDDRLAISRMDLVQRGSEQSIISELTSWQHRRSAGLFHYKVGITGSARVRSLDLVAKIKPSDEDVLHAAETTAAICDPRVHRELTRFRERIGIRGGHVRELEIYALQRDRRFREHMPLCYGTWRDEANQSWGLLLERLDGMAVMDAADDVSAWTPEHIGTAIDGIADLHAVWLERDDDLASRGWIGHVPTSISTTETSSLWDALAGHAAPMFAQWGGAPLVRTHAQLVDTIADWWPALEALPRTLIHNDFNARNVAIRRTSVGDRLVAYDWELATIGAPQRDLAEFLCFALSPHVDRGSMNHWVERHRVRLERTSAQPLCRERWHDGFRSALADVLITRLAFYALIHRVRPQTFLPRVVATWCRLYQLTTTPPGRV